MRTTARAVAVVAAVMGSVTGARGQEAPRLVAAETYARAERFLAEHTEPLVHRAAVSPIWLADGRFWYSTSIPGGREHILVDPVRAERTRAFDHARLASALSAAAGTRLGPLELGVVALDPERGLAVLAYGERRYLCTLSAYTCAPRVDAPAGDRAAVVSPDGTRAAFIRDHDLWVRELGAGVERRLTTDGQEDFGYATNNAGWVRSDRPVLKWSPDSRKIATFQHDARGVGMMYTTTTNVGHPELDAGRYPLAGDSLIFRISRVVIDLDRAPGHEVVRLAIPSDPHRSTCSDHVECGGEFGDVDWTNDGSRLVFVSSSRDHKRALVRVADAATGAVRDLFEEVEETFFDSGHDSGGNWRYLSASNQILWYSQRDDWGHLYLYDGATGRLLRRVTEGTWNVRAVLRVDEAERAIWLLGSEREGGDPYFPYLYRVGLDDGRMSLLTPDSAFHAVSISPRGDYFVDTYSTPVDPPVTVLRDRDGRRVIALEEADISALRASGWQPPLPFSVKARDGETDLWGLLFRPTGFDPSRSYPIVNYVYPGPMGSSVGSRAFRAAHRDLQAIAELGFVVVELDAMGTPGRSKPFHEAYYGNMGDNGLPDQITGIRQLAERYPWMDIERVGIYGHSGGGYAAADAILRHPDFYDVAVSQAGNHDNRNYEDDWAEKWQGLLEEYVDGTTNYDNQANQLLAENLVGKLLISHGTLDTNVPMSNTMLLVDALVAANKDFDLLVLPNRGHGYGNEPYMMRRRWDYFVRHLLGAEPPSGYEIGRLERPIS
jgi:dienelactone hydrolase